MLMSAAAQVRFALSVGLGLHFAPWSLDRLLDAVRETHREFGQTAAEGLELLQGPELDGETRQEMQLRRFRTQAVRAARETAYYEPLFERLELHAKRLVHDDLLRLPLTSKDALRDTPDGFVRRNADPAFRTTTTGTTGKQTSVSFSTAEMHAFITLSAISFLAAGHIDPSDVVLLSTSSRAALGNTCFAGACARIGSLVSIGGLVEPVHTLALLTEERHLPGKKARVSVLSTYPSYLGQLVEEGLRRGYRPADFGLERVIIGGELVSEGLKARSQRLFGHVQFDEAYAMTETWPVSGQRCPEGHLHFEPGQGLVEVVNPETAAPVLPGEAGTIVVTPFPPYRDTTILLRYDTEDMVRPIAGPLGCNLHTLHATTNLLGKRRLSVQHDRGWTFPRDILEVLEAMEEVPLPARFGFWAVPGGVAVEVMIRETGLALRDRIQRQLEERGVPVQEIFLLEQASDLLHPIPLRCDLREASFAPRTTVVPAVDSGLLRAGC